MSSTQAQLAEFWRIFGPFGVTDYGYLEQHVGRFLATKRIFESTWPRKGGRVLEVGALWLHQAFLYARDGYEVTGADLPETLGRQNVRELAEACNIRLMVYDELQSGGAFENVGDDSFDVILFTEIIEHLTFNPVAMWKQLYRMLAPGGRIVVTTPNYYALRGRAWDFERMQRMRGGGITVDDILHKPTYAPHWKEFSLREVVDYFARLSPDFAVHKALIVEDYVGGPKYTRLARVIERHVHAFRPNLHVEIELAQKQRGITLEPGY